MPEAQGEVTESPSQKPPGSDWQALAAASPALSKARSPWQRRRRSSAAPRAAQHEPPRLAGAGGRAGGRAGCGPHAGAGPGG